MDCLHKRYGNPFSFLNSVIENGQFCWFVRSFFETLHKEEDEQRTWEFYLHRVLEGSFDDFKNGIQNNQKNQTMTDTAMEVTVKNSMEILRKLSPEKEGVKLNGTRLI